MQALERVNVTSREIAVRGDGTRIALTQPAASVQSCPRALPCPDAAATIYVVDDDGEIRTSLRDVLEHCGYTVECFASGADFLDAHHSDRYGCLLVDAVMPGMTGIELIQRIKDAGDDTPAVVITGHAAVSLAVQAMKAGAFDFIEKPVRCDTLLAIVERALAVAQKRAELDELRRKSAFSIAKLTRKQTQILELVLAGHPSKNIAADLGISQRTVENHRAAIMLKTGSKSLAALIQSAICAHCIEGQRSSPLVTFSPSPRPLAAIEHFRSADASSETPAATLGLVSYSSVTV